MQEILDRSLQSEFGLDVYKMVAQGIVMYPFGGI